MPVLNVKMLPSELVCKFAVEISLDAFFVPRPELLVHRARTTKTTSAITTIVPSKP